MRAAINLFVLAAAVFAAAFATRRIFLWDVMPVAWEHEPQPIWALQAAFLLRSIEGVAITVAALALAGALTVAVSRRWRSGATSADDGAPRGSPRNR